MFQPKQVAEFLIQRVDVERLPGQVVEQVRQVIDDVAQEELQTRAGLGSDADVDRAGVDQAAEQVDVHWGDVQREHVHRRGRPHVERAAAAEVDPQVGRVEQAHHRAEHLVEGVGGLLEVDQVRHRRQVAQELAVAGLGRNADGDLAGPTRQAKQVDIDRGHDERGEAVAPTGLTVSTVCDGPVKLPLPAPAAQRVGLSGLGQDVADGVVVDQVEAERPSPLMSFTVTV